MIGSDADDVCLALANVLEESLLQEEDRGTIGIDDTDISQQSYIMNKLGYTAPCHCSVPPRPLMFPS